MRLPKKVILNNIPFKVVRNRKSFGSLFSYNKGLICVGLRGKPREALEGFLHKVAEISMIERGMRASKCKPQGKANEYVFQGSHRDFSDVITDVSSVVADLMRL